MSEIDKAISKALGIEWDGQEYPEPTLEELNKETDDIYDENGKDTTNSMYGKPGPNTGRKFPQISERMKGNTYGSIGPAWNKGLTKEKDGIKTGPKPGTFSHTDEAKEKMKVKIFCCGVGRNPGNHGRHLKSKH
jgi:hypothetical protein|tara:strand:- start:61 stop:462 length:402 start_codon:yes stop_codon:yes gene_type:complete